MLLDILTFKLDASGLPLLFTGICNLEEIREFLQNTKQGIWEMPRNRSFFYLVKDKKISVYMFLQIWMHKTYLAGKIIIWEN